jgi:hypothetical protein
MSGKPQLRLIAIGAALCAVTIALAGSKRPDTSPSQQIQTSARAQAAADPGCPDQRANRTSELCAQWKAADAAQNAATATWIAVILSFIGIVLVVLTFGETRRTARRQLRAYIAVDPTAILLNAETGEVSADALVVNSGQTPAFKTRWAGNLVISTDKELERDLRHPESGKTVGQPTYVTVSAGGNTIAGFKAHKAFPIKDLQAAVVGEKVNLFLFGTVWYEDAFGRSRYTNFCLKALKLPGPGEEIEPHEEGHFWVTATFYNDSD